MKAQILIGIYILIFQNLFSQTLKTYSGSFENGTATYHYYENENSERVYHGSFSYKSDELKITGSFKNNFRDGKWVIIKTKREYIKSLFKPEYPIEEVSSGFYKNGNLEGKWSYQSKAKATGNILKSSTVNFKNNIIVDKYVFVDNDEKVNLEFNLNKVGLFNGSYKLSYKKALVPFEDIRKYKNGVRYFQLHRNIQTGEILEKSEINPSIVSSINDSLVGAILLKNNKSICKIIHDYSSSLPIFDEKFNKFGNDIRDYFTFWSSPSFSLDNPLFYSKKGIIQQDQCFEISLVDLNKIAYRFKNVKESEIVLDSEENLLEKEEDVAEQQEEEDELNRLKAKKTEDSLQIVKQKEHEEERNRQIAIEKQLEQRKELDKLYSLKSSYEITLEEYEPQLYKKFLIDYSDFIKTEFSNSKLTKITSRLSLNIKVDSLGTPSVSLENFICSDEAIKVKIDNFIRTYKYPVLIFKGVKCDYKDYYFLTANGSKGEISFTVEPYHISLDRVDENVRQFINRTFLNKDKGYYKIKYNILEASKNNIDNYEVIKFKPD